MAGCAILNDPDHAEWPSFCPNMGASIFFTILFLACTVTHITQAVKYRKGYCWVIIMGAVWQTAAYALRSVSIKYYTNIGYYATWFLLILLSPLWINAYVYMVLGRMIYNYTSSAKVLGIKAWRCGMYFVILDVVAFIIQATGGSMASGQDIPESQVKRGLDIYMGGIGFQFFFIIVFTGVAFTFHRRMRRESPNALAAVRLLYTLYAVLVLISVRIIFRLVEYSRGFFSGIPTHEAYQYALDSTPMLVALILLSITHPGKVMPGKECDLPSRKERKAMGSNNVTGRAGGRNSLPYHESTMIEK